MHCIVLQAQFVAFGGRQRVLLFLSYIAREAGATESRVDFMDPEILTCWCLSCRAIHHIDNYN